MGWISPVFAHRVVDLATVGRVDGEALRRRFLRSIGLDPAAKIEPDRMIGDSEFFSLLERISDRVEGGRNVPIHVGASMRCDDYGAFGLAFKSAIDLGSSYARVERFGRVVTSIANFRVVRGPTSTLMEVIPGTNDQAGLRLTNEMALAAATALSREVGESDFMPLAVHISHSTSQDISPFEAHFRCPVHFEAQRDALEVANHRLQLPNRLGDSSLSSFFDAHLDDALATLPEHEQLVARVRAEIIKSLSEGAPTLARMASQLGMSVRTLQRRLGESGLNHRELVDEARKDLACRLLSSSTYGLAEIAFLTGFSEQSAFNRAFKQWMGDTPTAFRENAR